jgi:SAM-dependent methyltransferase
MRQSSISRKDQNYNQHDDQSSVDSVLEQLAAWYRKPLGALLLKAELQAISPIVSNLRGFHWVQLGLLLQHHWCSGSLIPHRMSIGFNPHHQSGLINTTVSEHPALFCRCDLLPFCSDSIDAVILPHVLEFITDPLDVLQEAWRILVPEGHLIILSFNAHSLWGLKRIFSFKQPMPPWNGRFQKSVWIQECLTDLGCEIVLKKTLFFRPPVQSESLLKKLSFMEQLGEHTWPGGGGVLAIVAKKKLVTVTPIKAVWEPAETLVAKGFEPTARGL